MSNWPRKYLLMLITLPLPLFGLWVVIDGLIDGPNYFGPQVLTLEQVEWTTNWVESHGRISGSPNKEEEVRMVYHFIDQKGQVRHGEYVFYPKELPQPRSDYHEGAQVELVIPLEPGEGHFSANRTVNQGLGVMVAFGLLGALVWLLNLRRKKMD